MSILTPPQGGWPFNPAGEPSVLDGAVEWLLDPARRGHDAREPFAEEAKGYLIGVATRLLDALRAEHRSPKWAEERDRAETIRHLARQLCKEIRAVEKAHMFRTLRLEDQELQVRGAQRETAPLVAANVVNALPPPHEHPLDALARAAQKYRDWLDAEASGSGRANLYMRTMGDPRLLLARDCAGLLLRYRGSGGAPIRDDGPVSELMARLWLYATGMEPDAGAMDRHAQEGAREVRALVEAPPTSSKQ